MQMARVVAWMQATCHCKKRAQPASEAAAKPEMYVVVDFAVLRLYVDLETAVAHENVEAVLQPRHESQGQVLDVIGLTERDDVRRVEQCEHHRRGASGIEEV